MRLAIVNDVHLGTESLYQGRAQKLSRFSERELERFLTWAAGEVKLDAVVQLGDLIERESYPLDAERYRRAVAQFQTLPQPVQHVIGNHEQAFLGEEDLRAWLGYDHLFSTFSAGGYQGVVLYSEQRPGILPRIGLSQLAWLEATLQTATQPVVLFVHHPLNDLPLDQNVWFAGKEPACLVENRAAVRRILEVSGKVVAVVQAHAHQAYGEQQAGIWYINLQSLVENVAGDDQPAGNWVVLELLGNKITLETYGRSRARQVLA